MGTDPKRERYPQMTQMAEIFRDADGEAERDGYPQISQMAQIPDPGSRFEADISCGFLRRAYPCQAGFPTRGGAMGSDLSV